MSDARGKPNDVADVVVVAIGRNEGERLVRCLSSSMKQAPHVVYVDSGSTDGSVSAARDLGAHVVTPGATPDAPFTAARARNAGVRAIRERFPGVQFYQFVDGDCEIVDGWVGVAREALSHDASLGVVCGRRRERFPDATVYNRLCDIEWDTPIGPARSCGGDAMFRAEAFDAVGGFRDEQIAGEEPELCVRLRAAGWGVERLDAEMTLHDAAMTRFGQWWRRNVRAGHAYAEGHHLHGRPPERHGSRSVRSNAFWGWAVPVGVAALTIGLFLAGVAWWPLGLLPLLAYPLLTWRVARGRLARGGVTRRQAVLYGLFTTLGKLPQAVGQWTFRRNRLLGRGSRIIEYKGPGSHSLADAPPRGVTAG